MKKDTSFRLRIQTELIQKARQTASERGETLSAIVRRYLEAYTASQPTKQADNI